jgi:hypothetical protein
LELRVGAGFCRVSLAGAFGAAFAEVARGLALDRPEFFGDFAMCSLSCAPERGPTQAGGLPEVGTKEQ